MVNTLLSSKPRKKIVPSVILLSLAIFSISNPANGKAFTQNAREGTHFSPETCTHFVAINGDDANNGATIEMPWRTIQKAANVAVAGDVVCIRAGAYAETVTVNVSGSETNGFVTFQSYPGEKAILDGAGLTVPSGWGAMIAIHNQSYVVIRGLTIRNYRTSQRNHVPIGILVSGQGSHIELRENVIYGIETNYTGSEGGDAHGIAVYGTAASASLSSIIIHNNLLYNLKLGSSEALVVNGNVDGFEITGNTVRDSNNIGIDAIGFEGVSPDQTLDQARNGVIRGNHIYNINSFGNPAYGNERSAGCIYLDGAANILVEQNIAHHCNIGIELASEHAGRATSNIIVQNNLVYDNTQAGISLGGYDANRGSTENSAIVNNTLYNNATEGDWGAELYIQYDTRNNVIMNNIIFANSRRNYMESWSTVMAGNIVDRNLYYSDGGGEAGAWIWKNTAYSTFSDYQAETGNDSNGFAGLDPLFFDAISANFNLQSISPAIDAGDDSNCPVSDFYGEARPSGAHCDIGGVERQADSTDQFIRFYSESDMDGWILESSETSNTGGAMDSAARTFIIGDDALDRQYRAILHFDTSALPDNAVITSAVLQLRTQGVSGTNPFNILGALRVDARNPDFGAPALQLADFRTSAAKNNIAIFNSIPVNSWHSAILNDIGRLYINRTGTTQFKIYFTKDDNDDLGADIIRFYSGNAKNALRPRLVIQYYVSP